MKKAFIFFIAVSLTVTLKAQTPEDSVKAVINHLFEAMKAADGKGLLSCFGDSAILETIVEKDGSVTIKKEDIKEFADFVSHVQENEADERLTFDDIQIDGPLAMVWASYKFYWKEEFIHCGVDAFQLVRMNTGWKIQHIIDTRRKDNCL